MPVSNAALTRRSSARIARMSSDRQKRTIQDAIAILEARLFNYGSQIHGGSDVENFLRLKLASCVNETFGMLFLDSHNRIIAFEILFEGSVSHATIYLREIARRVLHHNACGIFLVHNHPSGDSTPSNADRLLTHNVQKFLQDMDVRLIDHLIIGEGSPTSFAAMGYL
jgi:DNA repair protein RadC